MAYQVVWLDILWPTTTQRSEKSRKANHLQTVKYALKLITRIIALPTFLLKIDLMPNSVLTPSRPFFNFY